MIYYESNYLCHYGLKGMKWGQRRWQNADGTFNAAGKARYFGKSAGGNVRRALASAYGINERVYNKLGNKTLASMNKAAKEQMLEKAAKADQRKADRRQEKINAKNHKTAEKDAEINKRINSAKNSSEMESAMQKKVKEDLRRSQNPLSRTLNDISGYNNSIAKQVVDDVCKKMYFDDVKQSRSKMSSGQKFYDYLTSGSSNRANEKYKNGGYKNLNKEYEKYKSEGGIKKSKKNYADTHRALRQQRARQEQERRREEERRYNEQQRKRQEEMDRTVRQMNYLTGVYERSGNR